MSKQRLIDADALIIAIWEKVHSNSCDSDFRTGEAYGMAKTTDIIKSAPTIDTERHGHWIPTDKTDYGAPVFECSACGGEDSEIKGDFCRWCGARMDEKEPQT